MSIKIIAYVGSNKNESATVKNVKGLLKKVEKGCQCQWEVIQSKDYIVNICSGCNQCFLDGKCVYKDDFDKIYGKMLKADIIVWGSPVYVQHVSGTMKNFIDRCAKEIYTLPLRGKLAITVSSSGGNGNGYVNEYMRKVLNMLGAYVIEDVAFTEFMNKEKLSFIYEKSSKKIIQTISSECIMIDEFLEQRYAACKKTFDLYEDGNWIKKYWKKHNLFSFVTYAELIEHYRHNNILDN